MNGWQKHLVPPTHPVLKRVCDPVEAGENIADLADLMERVCRKSKIGVGLAAPQVGVSKRVIFLLVPAATVRGEILINPEITKASDVTALGTEGCLSFPGVEKVIRRPVSIIVRYTMHPSRKPHARRFDGFAARVVCHEIDHLNGICRVGDDSPPDGVVARRAIRAPNVAAALVAASLA
jgi:peptide deformylase